MKASILAEYCLNYATKENYVQVKQTDGLATIHIVAQGNETGVQPGKIWLSDTSFDDYETTSPIGAMRSRIQLHVDYCGISLTV